MLFTFKSSRANPPGGISGVESFITIDEQPQLNWDCYFSCASYACLGLPLFSDLFNFLQLSACKAAVKCHSELHHCIVHVVSIDFWQYKVEVVVYFWSSEFIKFYVVYIWKWSSLCTKWLWGGILHYTTDEQP